MMQGILGIKDYPPRPIPDRAPAEARQVFRTQPYMFRARP